MGQKQIRLSLGLFILFTSTWSVAQDFELGGIKYNHYPASSVKNNADAKFAVHEFGAFFNIPKLLSKDSSTVMLNGLGYAHVTIDHLDNPISASVEKSHLHSINYRFTLIHKLNAKWRVIALLEPTLASDFKEELSFDDLILQGTAMAIKTVNDKFKIGVGLGYTSRFGSPMVVPMIPITYQSAKHSFNAIFPVKFSYQYEVFQNLQIGIKGQANGANFNISDYSEGETDFNKLNYTRFNLGPVVNFKTSKYLNIELSGGISSNRQFNLVDTGGNSFERSVRNDPFLNIGLIFKPFN